MGYTQTRVQQWTEVAGMDGEKIFAVGGSVGNRVIGTGTGGTVYLDGPTVPAGTLWVICSLLALDATSAITLVQVGILRGGSHLTVGHTPRPAASQPAVNTTHVVLFPGDAPEGVLWGTVAGDSLYLIYTGYSMVMP